MAVAVKKLGALALLGGVGVGAYFLYKAYVEGTWPFTRTACKEGDTYCGSDNYLRKCVNGEWTTTEVSCGGSAVTPKCIEGSSAYTACWDGSLIVSSVCQNGEWVPTGNTCPPAPTTIKSVTFMLQNYETLDPAVGVEVELEGCGRVITGSDGKAKFYSVAPGTYKLWCRKTGWHPEDYGIGFRYDYVLADLRSDWVGKDIEYPRFIKMIPILPSKVRWRWLVEPPATVSEDYLTTYVKFDFCGFTERCAFRDRLRHPVIAFTAEVLDQWGELIPSYLNPSIAVISMNASTGTQKVGFTYEKPDYYVKCFSQLPANRSRLDGYAVSLVTYPYSEPLGIVLSYTDPIDGAYKTALVNLHPVFNCIGHIACGSHYSAYVCDCLLDNTYFGNQFGCD